MANTTLSGEQIIILLNEEFYPPTIFNDVNITFGDPTDAPDGATDYDSIVIATGQPGRGYYGTAEIHYTRVPLSRLEGLVTLYSQDAFTLQNICDGLNATANTFLDPVDFETPTIPTLQPGQSGSVTLTAATTSLGWKGSFDVALVYGKPFLNVAIRNNGLYVLTDDLQGVQHLDGLKYLFDIDFTSVRDALVPQAYQYAKDLWYTGFTDFGAIQNVCNKIGIPSFNAPWWRCQVGDYATSQVAGSNTKFDRVAVMGPVTGGAFTNSSMFFHYNVLENR